MTYQLSKPQYAAIYGCSTRTIARYRAAKAPLDDPAAMMALWASNKLTPPSASQKGQDAILADYAAATGKPVRQTEEKPPASKPGPLPGFFASAFGSAATAAPGSMEEGAPAALRRLQTMEVDAKRTLQGIDQKAEPLTYKAALNNYLRISESLRKFDLLVEQNRRDAGELVPRGEAEIACELAAMWLRLAVRTFINNTVPKLKAATDEAVIVRLIEDGMGAAVEVNLRRAPNCQQPLPPWAMAAIRKGYDIPATAEPTSEQSED